MTPSSAYFGPCFMITIMKKEKEAYEIQCDNVCVHMRFERCLEVELQIRVHTYIHAYMHTCSFHCIALHFALHA